MPTRLHPILLLLLAALSATAEAEDTAHCFSAIYALNENRLDEAITLYTRCIDEGELSNNNLVVAHNDRGNAYGKIGDYSNALADFNAVIALKPDDPDAFYNRGLTYKRLNEPDRAIADYSKAIRLNPGYFKAYNNRGGIYGEKGLFQAAIADFNQAIALNGKNASAFYNRGLAYYSLGEFDKAIADLERAIELNPNYLKAYENLAWLRGTCPDESLRDGIMALALAKKALLLQPGGTPRLYDIMAAAYAAQGSYDRAIQYQELAIDSAGENSGKEQFRLRLDRYRNRVPYDDPGGNRFLGSG